MPFVQFKRTIKIHLSIFKYETDVLYTLLQRRPLFIHSGYVRTALYIE